MNVQHFFQTITRACTRPTALIGVLAGGFLIMGTAFAISASCLQTEYNKVQKQKLNCTAGDVKIAQVVNTRDLHGAPLNTCIEGSTFTFIADFQIKTTSSQSRENIGLYLATNSTTQALTGQCDDNIISPQHQCPGADVGVLCGSDGYSETDPAPDNCGDTSSNDLSPIFGQGSQSVTIEVKDFACTAPATNNCVVDGKPAKCLVLPNCTSWQIPGGTIQCVSNGPTFDYPFNGPGGTPTAIPGTPSKCNCGTILVPITPVTVVPEVTKACTTAKDPGLNTSCDAGPEGSTVTYTVSIKNTSNVPNNNVVVDQICDSAYGNIFTAVGFSGSACPAGNSGITATNVNCPPGPIAPGATGTCTFTAVVGENVLGLVDTITSSGHSSLNTSSKFTQTSNEVTVISSDAASTAVVIKGFAANKAGCATVRYNVEVDNTSGADEVLTLSAFNDNSFGSITTVHNNVLGTTCGVASGIGTLAGSAGAGALPITIAAGGNYKCQFDGQFCSPLDANGCFTHTNAITATLAGDEGEGVTQDNTNNSVVVKECLVPTINP